MSQLPTNRTTADTATTHVADHNEVHRVHDILDTMGLNVVSLHLNATAIGTLRSAPTQILAAPGSAKMYGAIRAIYEWKPGTCGFATAGGAGMIPMIGYSTGGVSASDMINTTFGGSVGFTTPVAAILSHSGQDGNGTTPLYARSLTENLAVMVSWESSSGDPVRAGPIVTSAKVSGGSGYAVNDTGTINTQNYTGGATYTVNTVSAGAVLTYTINSGGDGYSTNFNPVSTTKGGAQAGSGSGFTINVNSIPAADGDLYVELIYYVVALH